MPEEVADLPIDLVRTWWTYHQLQTNYARIDQAKMAGMM